LIKKKLLAISNAGFMLGGGEHAFVELLSSLNHEWEPVAAVPNKGDLLEKLNAQKIQIFVAPLSPIRPWLGTAILKSLRSYFQLCRKLSPSLIYANGSRAALYGGVIGKILKIPVIWHCRIADRDLKLDPILGWLITQIIANSHATASRFKTGLQRKIQVIHNGVDLKWLTIDYGNMPSLLQNSWKTILVVARASRWKQHDHALTVFENLAQSDPTVHLVNVGAEDGFDRQWWAYLQRRTAISSFADRIHWIGHVEDIRPWYRHAAVLLMPSQNESFGRVIVEAMASGLPVVAYRDGGIPEIVNHMQDGCLVEPGNVRELTDATASLMYDHGLRSRFIKNGKQRAGFFGLDKHRDNVQDLFTEVSKQGPQLL
jgi:glycosyltransferase involved in cell wall biosynthesis